MLPHTYHMSHGGIVPFLQNPDRCPGERTGRVPRGLGWRYDNPSFGSWRPSSPTPSLAPEGYLTLRAGCVHPSHLGAVVYPHHDVRFVCGGLHLLPEVGPSHGAVGIGIDHHDDRNLGPRSRVGRDPTLGTGSPDSYLPRLRGGCGESGAERDEPDR